MAYRPPKGVRPPQLEGKRPGRPKGSRNHAKVWADIEWAYVNRFAEPDSAPSITARFWWRLAASFPDEFEFWLSKGGRVVDPDEFYYGC
jgi:hypothetical protein